MANHVSALKRARQTAKKTAVNRSNKTHFRSTLRALREALQKGDSNAAATEYRTAVSVIDKSVKKGVIHANTGSRYKSRLNTRVRASRHGQASHRQSRKEIRREISPFAG